MKTFNSFLSIAFLLCFSFGSYAQSEITDTDGNTTVETNRANANDDIIWFQTAGTDRLRINNAQLEFLNTGGSIFIGEGAGANDDLTNNLNLFIGDEAGTVTTSGAENVAIGRRALFTNTTGDGNMAVGSTTLYRTTTGGQNAGIGKATLFENTTGSRNVGIGFSTLRNAVTADDNVAIGSRAGFNTLGGLNVLIGSQAGFNVENGANNTLIGYQAGRGAAKHDKSGSVMIGNQAGYNETTSNKLYIDNSPTVNPLIYGDFDGNYVKIHDQLGIKTIPETGTSLDVDDIGGSRTVTVDHTTIGGGNDLVQLTVQSDAPDNAAFIEFERGGVVANINTDGSADFHSLRVDRKQSSGNDGNIIVQEASTGGFSRVTMRDQSGSDYWDIATLANDSIASQMRFWYSDQAGNSKNILNIDGIDHKVGINTTNPTGFLHVETENYSTSAGIDVDVNYSGFSDVRAVDASSIPEAGYGYGVYATGGYMGVRGIGNASTYTGTAYGVHGTATASGSVAGVRYGVYGSASGGDGGTRYGLYGNAFQGANGTTYGAYANATGGTEAYGMYGNTTGDGTRYGSYGEATVTSGTGYGLYGKADGGTTGTRYAIYGEAMDGSTAYGIRTTADAESTTSTVTRYGAYLEAEGGTSGTRYGAYGRAEDGSTGYGMYGYATSGSESGGTRYGVRGFATGGTTGSRYGVYGSASGGANAWGGYFPTKVYATELRIGTTSAATGYKLAVNGKAICEELKVQDSGSWPDYVFADEYDLKPLAEVEAYINEHKHLPNIPSAAQIDAEEGFMIGEMQNKTIEKVEELTLYMIDADKRIKELEKQNAELREMVEALLESKK